MLKKAFLYRLAFHKLKKQAFSASQKPFFFQNLFFSLPKATLFHHKRRKFPPSHNLLSTKEHGCSFYVRSNSLRYNAGTSHRFKSLPAIPDEVAAFRKTGYLMIAGHFNNNHVSTGDLNRPRSPEVRKPLVCFLVLFAQCKKNVKTFPFREAPRFCKPRISTNKKQICTIQLNPFFALRRCPCRDGTLRVLFRRRFAAFLSACGGPMLLPQQTSAAK